MNPSLTYQEKKASKNLQDLVHSFWTHKNPENTPQEMTISPDSFFKIIFIVQENKIIHYFMTGLWTKQKDFTIPPNCSTFGCRLKVLAPEYLLNQEVASIINNYKQLELSFLNINNFKLTDFTYIVKQWEAELLRIKPTKAIHAHKLRLSQLLYNSNGDISAAEIAQQIFWTNRQINRYLNKYIGVSLKKYLNIQKCYASYVHIVDGELTPQKNYFDQAHFIKEVRKHTGETPRVLHQEQNDRFLQLKNIQQK